MRKALLISLILIFTLVVSPAVFAAKTCVYDFKVDGCPHCLKVAAFLDDMEEKHDLDIHYIDASEDSQLFAKLLRKYNVSQDQWGKVPAVFVGEYVCIGDTPCIANLEEEFRKNKGTACPDDENAGPTEPEGGAVITLGGITLLALVDAINPCALAVLIILLSTILLRDPKKRHKAMHAGLAFSFAVFAVYFSMGVLLVFGLKWVTSVTSLSTVWLYKTFGVVAIILGLLNMKDYFRYGAGGFIMEVPQKWRPAMKGFIQSVTSVRGAFIVGIIVSLFLLPCTAGPYFVAGGLLSGVSWNTAIPWLAYYNLLFIAPMLAITFIVYGGVTAVEEISGWRERNIRRLHLVAGVILVVLGVLMVTGIV